MKQPARFSVRNLLLVGGLSLALSLSLWACSGDTEQALTSPQFTRPGLDLSITHPQIQTVMRVQDQHTPDLMQVPGVVGTATSQNASGEIVIKVYTEDEFPKGKLPAAIEGIEVVSQASGRIVAFKGPPGGGGGGGGGGADPRAPQSAPIKLGTSGGWADDLANGYCCGGTIGSLIKDGNGNQYVLSNYHVLYADIVSGGNGIVASAGDNVIQPALIDVGCNKNNALAVATLLSPSTGASLPSGNIDAGIAAVIPGQVAPDGEILDIGTISSSTVAAFIGQGVKKMGRTTGLGRANVDGLNANIQIGYENECAGGSAFTKTFTGQIITTNDRCKFLDGGDSGSLMVEDVSTNPRAVGLLYAGSVSCNKRAVAVANPINDVLSFYSGKLPGTVTMVGN